MVCERCGCRMIAKTSPGKSNLGKSILGKAGMVCVDCGHPVSEIHANRGPGNWLQRLCILGVLLVLALLPALVGTNGLSERGSSKPLTEQSQEE